jgi:hypothetical protein
MMFDPDLEAPLNRRERQRALGEWDDAAPRSWYADPHGFSATASLDRRQRRRNSNSLLLRLRAPAATLWSWAEADGTLGRAPVNLGPELDLPDLGPDAISAHDADSGRPQGLPQPPMFTAE